MKNRRFEGSADRPVEGSSQERTAEPPDPRTAGPSALPRTGRLLAVDWGVRRIGLAVSDPNQTIAQPLGTLTRRTGRRFPMREFREHVERQEPVGIVVGLPLTAEGAEETSAKEARKMAALIAEATNLPVYALDERFTSSRAHRALREARERKPNRTERIDPMAAAVLLQSFLDRRFQ